MSIIGICGDNCACCPRYIATQNGRIEELEKVKELWVRLGFRDPAFPTDAMACFGCKPEIKCAYAQLRTCANKKTVDNCGLCREYPCERINAAFEKTEKIRAQADLVCTSEEMAALDKAFFSKRLRLDRLHFGMKADNAAS